MPARAWILLALTGLAAAADLGPDLLTAARKGQVDRVRALIDQKAPIESLDKDGRTPLMLAAGHGHAAAVKVLLEKGASADARDKQGWTAYGLALLSDAGGRGEVLKLLPVPRRWNVTIEAALAPGNLYGSCRMGPQQLAQFVAGLRLDSLVLDSVRAAAAGSDAPIALVPSGGDAVAALRVRPQVSCVQQSSADNISLAIDVRVTAGDSTSPLWEKTFGGGLKGLHTRRAASPAQYQTLFADWAKTHAGPIYWGIVSALMRSK